MFIYILRCSNNSLYTGYTTDLERRYQEHCSGSAKCKYTRSFPPQGIACYWQINADKATALKIEHTIKKLSRQQKINLCQHPELLAHHLREEDYSDTQIDSLVIQIGNPNQCDAL